MLKAKLKWTIPREFLSVGAWLFRTLHVSCYGARLAEERRKKKERKKKGERKNKMNNAAFRLFQVPTRLTLLNSYYTLLLLLQSEAGSINCSM